MPSLRTMRSTLMTATLRRTAGGSCLAPAAMEAAAERHGRSTRTVDDATHASNASRGIRSREHRRTEAERAGVTQIVYLGGLGDDAPDLSPHLRSRTETGAILSSATVPVATLRAAVVVGRGSAAFETIVALVDRLPMMVAPRWVSTPTQPIALTDMVATSLESRAGPRRWARASTSAART